MGKIGKYPRDWICGHDQNDDAIKNSIGNWAEALLVYTVQIAQLHQTLWRARIKKDGLVGFGKRDLKTAKIQAVTWILLAPVRFTERLKNKRKQSMKI